MTTREYGIQAIKDEADALLELIPKIDKNFDLAVDLIRKVRKYNPPAKIVWILPGSDCRPELAAEAVKRAQEEGMKDLYAFTLPDYGPEETGARWHPNAEYNRKAGLLLAQFLCKLQ